MPGAAAGASVEHVEAQTREWEAQKRREREAAGDADTSALAGISRGMPEWQRAVKLQSRAARVGFDWPGPGPVIAKLHEEIMAGVDDSALRLMSARRAVEKLGMTQAEAEEVFGVTFPPQAP